MNEKCRKVVSVTGINNLINPEHEDWWSDVAVLTNQRERIGYPTQKPLALLDRIIKASSNEGDMVLDPFAGCATACVAAERLDRQWVGIDISEKAARVDRSLRRRSISQSFAGSPMRGTAQITVKISFKLLDQRTWARSNRDCPYRMTLPHLRQVRHGQGRFLDRLCSREKGCRHGRRRVD